MTVTNKGTIGEILEEQIDSCGLQSVVEALSEICTLKCDHLRHNWQDDQTARAWFDAAKLLDVAASKLKI